MDITVYKKWCRKQRKMEGTQEWIDLEIRSTIQHALGQKDNDIESAILQVTCLRLAYNLNHGKCIAAILKSIIEASCSDKFKNLNTLKPTNINPSLNEKIKVWAPHINKFRKIDIGDNIFLTDYLENYCRYRFYEYPKVFQWFFPSLLHQLYMNDVLEEDGLYSWKEATEESISESSSSGSSADVIQEQIKYSLRSLSATEQLFEWFETASSESSE